MQEQIILSVDSMKLVIMVAKPDRQRGAESWRPVSLLEHQQDISKLRDCLSSRHCNLVGLVPGSGNVLPW